MKAIALGALLIAVASPARAAEITLRMGDSLPVGHVISETATKPWIDLVEKKSDGRLAIDYFPAEQVGKAKDFLSLTQTGLLDIGYIGPGYVSEKMPLSAVAELPGASRTSCEVMRTYWSLVKEGGWLFEHEYAPNGIRPLFVIALPPYQMILGDVGAVTGVEALRGKKIRASGGAQSLTLEALGIVPVRMAPPEIYEAMTRGMIDGALLAHISVGSYKLTAPTTAVTKGENFGTVVVAYSIGERKWDSLPEDIQTLLKEAGDELTLSACAAFDQKEGRAANELRDAGITIVDFGEEDEKVLRAASDKIAGEWAASLDERGQAGSEALTAFRDALDRARAGSPEQ
ncbi:MAG: TRAP transporter substrate-binding protein DctP [Rhodospirillum sp.]|nr:TRAP transporter substrate-binding protein DctP [Rhodospirillum sp.]MCF8490957.1 TRAP transporter substrate-binding protein DctP [Rhodospirillum sp.]MCF8501475.1 TRAP transporter substrate-binding protein DctP [Rhodospirillum sp.]